MPHFETFDLYFVKTNFELNRANNSDKDLLLLLKRFPILETKIHLTANYQVQSFVLNNANIILFQKVN